MEELLSRGFMGIEGYDSTIKFAASGITRPLIVKCVGTDGNYYKQLVKPKDDLRQDAVMQQVFRLVNSLLQSHPETRKRQLMIR